MSPLTRSRASSSFRRRLVRPRTFRTQWVGFAIGSGVLPPDTSLHETVISGQDLMRNYGLNQPTIIRIRGELLLAIGTGAVAATEQALVYVGLHVIDAEDAEAGGNPNDPFTNNNSNEWLFYRAVYLASFPSIGATGDTRNPILAAARFDIDVKSRRRIQAGQVLAVAYTFPPPAANAATSIGAIVTGRALFHEFGR